jgi:hypothetical protein
VVVEILEVLVRGYASFLDFSVAFAVVVVADFLCEKSVRVPVPC